MFRIASHIFMLLILASMASHQALAADSCQPLQNAAAKLATTPTHIYATTVSGTDKPTITEMIYAKGAVYGKVGGSWMRTALTPQELVAQDQEKQKNGSCQYLEDESIGGETAAVGRPLERAAAAAQTAEYSRAESLQAKHGAHVV